MVLVLLGWFVWLLVGGLMGIVVNRLTVQRLLITHMIIGILGAFISGLVFSQLGIPSILDFNPLSMVVVTVGASILLFLYRMLNRTLDSPHPRQGDTSVGEQTRSIEENNRRFDPGIQLRRMRIPVMFVIALLVMLPLFDLALWTLRLPNISSLPPQFGTIENYRNDYGTLDYLVFTPSSYAPDTPIPLVVLLHGCLQDPYILEMSSGMTAIANANNFILLYPQQNAASSPHRCWNWYAPENQQRGRGEPSLIVGIVDQVKQNYAVDAQQVYLAGISSGGAMTSTIASCYPDVFAAAAVHSGMAYESAISVFQAIVAPLRGSQVEPNIAGRDAYNCAGSNARTVPVLILHGSVDTIVFPINGDHVLQQFAQFHDYADDDLDNDSISAIAISTVPQQVEGGYTYRIEDFESDGMLQRYTIDGLWHMWSGGTGILPLSDPKAPNASQIFWEFFQAHPMS